MMVVRMCCFSSLLSTSVPALCSTGSDKLREPTPRTIEPVVPIKLAISSVISGVDLRL